MALKAGIKLALDVYEPYGPQVLQHARLTEQLGGRFDAAGRALAAADKFFYGYYPDGAGGAGRVADFASLFTPGFLWLPASNFAGILVPLIGSNFTNTGFVSGDWNVQSGLTGASGKFLNTGVTGNSIPQNSCALLHWTPSLTGAALRTVGCRNLTSTRALDLSVTDTTTIAARIMRTDSTTGTRATGTSGGFGLARRSSSANYEIWSVSGGTLGSTTITHTSGTRPTEEIYVGALNAGGSAASHYTGTLGAAGAMGASPSDAQVNILYNALSAFSTARAGL